MLLILIILDCIMNLNIKVEQQSIKSSISQLSQYLSNKLQFLKIFSQSIAKLSLNRYPIKQCIQVWTHLAESIMQRCKLYEQTGCRVLVLSTAFFWMIPKLVTFYQQLWKYIKDYCEGRQGGHVDFQRLKEVIDVINQKNQYSFGADRIDQILKIPLFCLQEIVIRITVITSLLENKLRKKENDDVELNKSYMRKMEIMWSQFQNLHKAIDQINKIMIIFTQKEDNNQCQKYKICLQKTNIIMDQYASIGADKVRFIKRYIHRLKLIKHWKNLSMKRKNRLKDRKISILQLINGENNYLKGLQEYIKYIKQPIQMKKILDGNQLRLLFSSIMQIKILHERIYKQLNNYFDEYNDQQCYAPIIAQLIPSFKKYTQYVLNAQAAQTYMKQLITNNLIVTQIGRQYTLKTKKQAQNELLQPTFRIARYQALFHQIIKRTPTSHRDFKLFLDVQASFKDVLTEVNNAVDKIIRNSKLQQLDREFGTHDCRIFNNNRQYLTEFSVSLIREYLQDVILYICNDMIIMVEQNTRKKLRIIPINEDFFARREEDNKIFKNMVTIHSDGLMTFTVGLQQIYANKAEQLGNLLKSLMTQSLKLVQVSVLGTEQIGSTSFSKYTEYILQVKYLDVKKLLHMRFRNIEKLSWEMQKYYNNSLKIEGENLRKSWFNSHTSQTIESRKMKIVQIFQKLFNNEIIRKNPSFFLKSISFPENFFEAARNSYQKRVSLSQTVTISRLKRSYLSRQQKKQAFTILCAAEIVLGRQLFYDNEINQKLKKLKDQANRIQIRVNTLDEEQVLTINITEYDTVEDVCNRISRIKGLRWNRDFRLFHEIGKKQLRVLEHEQILTKIFQFPKSQQSPILIGIYDKFKSSFSKIFAQAYPTLIFKKYLYLPYEIELPEMRKDLVRMRMTTCQVFSQIQDTKYELSYDEYLLFLAMYIYIHLDGDIVRLEEIDLDVVHKVIPDRVFKLKDQTEKVWIEKSRRYLPRIYEQIQKIREHNQKQLQQGRKIIDTVSKSSLYFGRKFLCSQLLLNKISKNHIFGSNIFYVQLHRTCFNQLQQRKLKVAYNMWLAISLKSIKLLSQSSKQAVFQLKYEDLGKPLVYAAGIVFKTSGAIQELYRFNTYQSFEISQLFKYNKALSEILNNLDVDKDLNMRVKKYRDDLLFHKETFSSSQVDLSCLR